MLCVNIYWHSKKKTKFFLKLELTLSIIHSVEDKEVDDRGPEKDLSSSNKSIKDDAFTKSRRTTVSITISSNQAASYTALHMKRANSMLTKSLQRLSSGKRIVSPADDAGGLAVGMKLQSSLKRAAASRMNTQNGTSFLQMQDSVMKVAGEILDRMAELKSFFNDVSKGPDDRETYNHEFTELQKELNSLKAQKFNGVSLFATREPDNNPLKIITSDDGLGEHIELRRTGFFENLKSRYGADGELNTGSNGSFRQIVGSFTNDGGLTDAHPNHASRDYAQGAVVFKNSGIADDSGYFMALTHVKAGVLIEDTASPTTQWIRIADAEGKGFAEAYPSAAEFNPDSIKYTSAGNQVAYLKGDIIKVPAHWASPGSNLFLRAEADVPRGLTLQSIFALNASGAATHIGAGKYFKYVGEDTMDGSKPTTEYIRANMNLAEPIGYSSGATADLISIMKTNAANNFNPAYVKDGSDIYAPAFAWNIDQFVSISALNYGDKVFHEQDGKIYEMTNSVKGTWGPDNYRAGDYVLHAGKWHQVVSGTVTTERPQDHTKLEEYGVNIANGYSHGQGIYESDSTKIVRVATSIMQGLFNSQQNYAADNVVYDNGKFWKFNADAASTLSNDYDSSNSYSAGNIVRFGGNYFEATGTIGSGVSNAPDQNGNWTQLSNLQAISGTLGGGQGALTDVTVDVGHEADNTDSTSVYFRRSPFQAYDTAGGGNYIGDPTKNLQANGTARTTGGSVIDRSAQYNNVSNEKYWTKTHFGALNNITVNTSYNYGDNIYYQGKNYIYTSHLASDHFLYLKGADPSTGYTEFENLLELGAVRELPMYVDTIGGGGNGNLPEGIYYKPNQDLNYVERHSDSGMVRTKGTERRTDAPMPPGDEIYNSADDQFYGGLNAGNDGIYGTADDFYATTVDPNIARNGGQIDADADNNKDLLDSNLDLQDFSVADFVDYIQTLANVRAVNGGTMSRLGYAERILEENEINLGAATSRIMDADMAYESTKMASHNVLLQAAASMVTQANSLNSVVLSLLQ
jgi:flagellin-like hook-associated protein FlgL